MTYQELIGLATQIRDNSTAASNTAELVGSTVLAVIQYFQVRSGSAAIDAEVQQALELIDQAGTTATGSINTAKEDALEAIAEAIEGLEVHYDIETDKGTVKDVQLKDGSGNKLMPITYYDYDVSANNPTAGPNNDGKFESLSALLSDKNLDTLIPNLFRKGGMSIKYVQSSDNKYVQYRLMSQSFNTDIDNWCKTDNEYQDYFKPAYFIGKGDTFTYGKTFNLTPGAKYKIFMPKTWPQSVVSGGIFGITIESYDSENAKTIIFSLFVDQVNSGTNEVYEFTVPNDSVYIKIGGRATIGTKVDFVICISDFNIIRSEIEREITPISNKINQLEYQSKNVTLLYTTNFIPNIDTINGVIDFGNDPILVIGHKVYVLRTIHSDSTKYRAVNYISSEESGAGIVIFNKDTKEFGVKVFSSTFADDEVIIGTIRTKYGSHEFISANFPFKFTVDGLDKVEYSYNAANVYQDAIEKTSYANLRGNVEVIAHRGVHVGYIPENSLDAYRYAGYLGYDKAETDFCPTSDGILVLMHDRSINRTMKNASDYSNIAETVNVIDKTYAELKAGYVLASSDERYRRPIPTLEEYFKTCKESGVFPLPEIKTSGITQAHVLEAFNMGCEIMGEGNFGFCSFSEALLDYVRTLSDITPLYYITGAIVDTVNSISGESRNDKHNVWYPSGSDVTEQSIKAHHEKGIRVVTWTITQNSYDNQIKLGCDGVATDAIAPNISSLMTVGIKTINGFGDLKTNGTTANNKLTLNNGQTATYLYSKRIYLGAFYISIVCKGSFTISSNGLSVTIKAAETERFVYRGLIVSSIPSFTITSSTDGSEIEFVEYYIQKF